MRCHPTRWLWGLIPIAMLSWLAVHARIRPSSNAISSSAAARRSPPPVTIGRRSPSPVATACWSAMPPARASATRRRPSCAMFGACAPSRRALRCRRPATCLHRRPSRRDRASGTLVKVACPWPRRHEITAPNLSDVAPSAVGGRRRRRALTTGDARDQSIAAGIDGAGARRGRADASPCRRPCASRRSQPRPHAAAVAARRRCRAQARCGRHADGRRRRAPARRREPQAPVAREASPPRRAGTPRPEQKPAVAAGAPRRQALPQRGAATVARAQARRAARAARDREPHRTRPACVRRRPCRSRSRLRRTPQPALPERAVAAPRRRSRSGRRALRRRRYLRATSGLRPIASAASAPPRSRSRCTSRTAAPSSIRAGKALIDRLIGALNTLSRKRRSTSPGIPTPRVTRAATWRCRSAARARSPAI